MINQNESCLKENTITEMPSQVNKIDGLNIPSSGTSIKLADN